ncbi:hypothetical protein ACQPZ2_30915 [Nocardia pseudovaccinii]|uniref:hypothetical protein n=1 Tax=Nocardia pseudovaccinii TaxID=189540 RepID=UPI003D8BA155
MIFEVTACDEVPTYWGAEYPPNPDVGHLYVMLFDSGGTARPAAGVPLILHR